VLAADASGRLRVVAHAAGDGTVTRASATGDERVGGAWQPEVVTPIAWDCVTFLFRDHLGITTDPAFTDNLLYLCWRSRGSERRTGAKDADAYG